MPLTIQEIARETGLEESVLRYYESEYPDELPEKQLQGDRYVYERDAVAAFLGIDQRCQRQSGELAATIATGARYGRVIAVTSGKGGVGKTNLALNLAIELQRAGKLCLILDADMGMANIHLLAGILPRHDLGDLLSGEKNVEELIAEGPEGVGLIPGGSGTLTLADSNPRQRQLIIAALAEIERRADVILVDTGAGMGKGVRDFLAAADEVLFVLTPDITSLADAYGLLKAMQRAGGAKRPVYCLVNMAESLRQAADVASRFSTCAGQFLGVTVENIGYVLKDATVAAAVNRRVPLSVFRPESRAARNIANVAGALLHRQDPEVVLGSAFKRYLNMLGEGEGR